MDRCRWYKAARGHLCHCRAPAKVVLVSQYDRFSSQNPKDETLTNRMVYEFRCLEHSPERLVAMLEQ